MPGVLRCTVAFVAALAVAVVAQASTVRFFLRPGWTVAGAEQTYANGLNAQPTIDRTSCRLTTGTRLSGWLHFVCTGLDTVHGTAHRYTLVYTPLTCTSMQVKLVIVGVDSGTRRVGWAADAPLTCHRQ